MCRSYPAVLVLTFFFTICSCNPQIIPVHEQAPLPIGTPEQIAWAKAEMACFIHWNMATADGTQGCACQGPAPDIRKWNPTALDTDSWIVNGIKMGCRRFVYVAKHNCGFVTWNSKVPNYPYTVSNAPNKTDVVANFVASAKKYNVGYGFYYSTVINAYVKVCNSVVQPGSAYTQDQYNQIVIAHLTELWGQYGPLAEVWFDGGYNRNLTNSLKNLFSTLQPHVVGFQADGLMPSPVRWVGTESGYAPYPCWSTANYGSAGAGSPDATSWFPAETDFTLQKSDQWFYNSAVEVHTPEELRNMYETSVGHNTALIIDFAPFPNGSLPRDQVQTAIGLGTFVQQCYNYPIIQTASQGQKVINLMLSNPSTVDRVMLQEDQTKGQLIRAFTVTATLSDGSKKELCSGSSVGNKFIQVLNPPVDGVFTVTLNVTSIDTRSPAGAPFIPNFALYSCSKLAKNIDATWRSL